MVKMFNYNVFVIVVRNTTMGDIGFLYFLQHFGV